MFQIFISYKSEDREDKCKPLAEKLKSEGFETWFDEQGIEGGDDDWFGTIRQNLEQAFVVIVIVTRKSLESHYITYEWAYAKGLGLTVIPLLYEENLPSEKNPIRHMQGIKCIDGVIPTRLIEQLRQVQRESLRFKSVQKGLRRAVFPLIPISHLSSWLLNHWLNREIREKSAIEIQEILFVAKKVTVTAVKSVNNLEQLWLSSSNAFAGRQTREYEKLNEIITGIKDESQELVKRINNPFSFFLLEEQLIPLVEQEVQNLLQIIEIIDQLQLELVALIFTSSPNFEDFDKMLQDVSQGKINVFFNPLTKEIPPALIRHIFKDVFGDNEIDKVLEIILKIGKALQS